MKTYYTKCGRQFEKSSMALVTGYPTPEGDKQCEECPFRVEVKEGWPPVFKRWECRAGSLPPNQQNTWRGSLKDKNTIHIDSLHNDFLEAVLEYCRNDEDLSATFNQDLDDCRRTISVSCSGNKKGIEAKKALVEKFFTKADEMEEDCDHCEDCKHSVDEGESVEYIKCSNKKRFVTKKQKACKDFSPAIIPDWSSKNCIDCEYCVDSECTQGVFKNCCPSKITPIVKACPKFKQKKVEQPKEVNELKCTKHRCPFNDDMNSECGFNPMTDDAHKNEMKEARDDYECTNEKLLAALDRVEKQTAAYNIRIPLIHRVDESERCISRNEGCPSYIKHNEGCSLYVMKGRALQSWLNSERSKCECPVYEKFYKKTVTPEGLSMEMVKPEDPAPVEAFDYSTVDQETAAFLQEKAVRITRIRMEAKLKMAVELEETFAKFAKLPYGNRTELFDQWVGSIGISPRTARNYIDGLDWVRKNFETIEDAMDIQPSLLFEVSKPSAPKELQDKVLSGDITSHKQYKELEEQLKAIGKAAQTAVETSMKNRERAEIAEKKAEAAERALKQSQDQHKSKNDLHNTEIRNLQHDIVQLRNELKAAKASGSDPAVEDLQKQLKEAQRQVDLLTDELMKPLEVEPAVVEKIPEEIEKELAELREKTSLENDYMFVFDILNMLRIAHPTRLRNWAKVIAKENSAAKAGEIRNELIDFGTKIESMIDYLDEEVQKK